jgi:hypothetical protein
MLTDWDQVHEWRRKAAECRATGQKAAFRNSRESFEELAASYEQLADHLEARLQHRKPRPAEGASLDGRPWLRCAF